MTPAPICIRAVDEAAFEECALPPGVRLVDGPGPDPGLEQLSSLGLVASLPVVPGDIVVFLGIDRSLSKSLDIKTDP